MKKFKITACGKESEMQLIAREWKYPPSCDRKETYIKDAQTLMTFIKELPHATVLEFKKIFK